MVTAGSCLAHDNKRSTLPGLSLRPNDVLSLRALRKAQLLHPQDRCRIAQEGRRPMWEGTLLLAYGGLESQIPGLL